MLLLNLIAYLQMLLKIERSGDYPSQQHRFPQKPQSKKPCGVNIISCTEWFFKLVETKGEFHMKNEQDWQTFQNTLCANAQAAYNETMEHQYYLEMREFLDDLMKNNLDIDQRDLFQEFLDKLILAKQREQELLYQEGFHDCIWLLKRLGVLA